MSELMKIFLSEYYRWLKDPVMGGVFVRHAGLCENLSRWCEKNKLTHIYYRMAHELVEMFEDDNLDYRFPFNTCGEYKRECIYSLCHLNKKRISWIEDKLNVEPKASISKALSLRQRLHVACRSLMCKLSR